MTDTQISQIKRLSKHIVLALDADAAGQMATLRSLETMNDALADEETAVPDAQRMVRLERRLNAEVSIVRLPEGKDPDELIRRAPERWPEVVASAVPFLDFYIAAVTDQVSPDDARAKSEAIKKIAPVLRQIGDRVIQAHYVSLVASRLRITDERVVLGEIRRTGLQTAKTMETAVTHAAAARVSYEDHLLAILLQHLDLCRDIVALVPIEDLLDSRNREMLLMLRDHSDAASDVASLIARLDDLLADHATRLISTLEGKPAQFPGQVQREARQALDNLGRERSSFLIRQLKASIQAAQEAGDDDSLDTLRRQLPTLAERHRRFDPPLSPYFRDTRDKLARV